MAIKARVAPAGERAVGGAEGQPAKYDNQGFECGRSLADQFVVYLPNDPAPPGFTVYQAPKWTRQTRNQISDFARWPDKGGHILTEQPVSSELAGNYGHPWQ